MDAVQERPVEPRRGGGTPKVVFVLPFPPTTDFRRKFFVRELEAAGITTEYWDVADVMGYAMKFTTDHDGLAYRAIPTRRALAAAIAAEDRDHTVYVLQITRGIHSWPIYRVFTRAGVKLVFFGRGYLPSPPPERSPGALLRKLLVAGSVKSVATSVASRLLRGRVPFTRPYDTAFVAGEAAERHHRRDAAAIKHIHHFDVDAAADPAPAGLPERYIAFVDDYLPHHPDFATFRSRTVDPTAYYAALNRAFAACERSFGVPVIVAAHPKAIYDRNPFGGRAVVFGATGALVRESVVVLAHASTAVSFAVIHRKPLALLYTREIAAVHPYLFASMRMTAGMLGCPLVDMEETSAQTVPRDGAIDESRYAAYAREYLSVADPSLSSARITVRALARLAIATALPAPADRVPNASVG